MPRPSAVIMLEAAQRHVAAIVAAFSAVQDAEHANSEPSVTNGNPHDMKSLIGAIVTSSAELVESIASYVRENGDA